MTTGEAGEDALTAKATDEGNVERVSTRGWAQSCQYDPEKLFTKLFHDDIKYLLSMDNLWKSRRPPTPLDWKNLPDAVEGSSREPQDQLKDQRCWSIAECASVFSESCKGLWQQFQTLKEGDHLVWDKDDRHAMDFVAACANIRSYIFGIPQKSRFDVKCKYFCTNLTKPHPPIVLLTALAHPAAVYPTVILTLASGAMCQV
ncbi:Ubiquitin-activating enzyme E1-like [Homalodisca vitripennis]|nr:Ubiquitin-activating enzyme E1-like [Homalodisca vitripennis]